MTIFSIRTTLLALLSVGSLLVSSLSKDAIGMQSFFIDSLLPSSSCSSPNKAVDRKSTLSVIPRDGPCNPHSSREKGRDYDQLFHLDNERVASIQSRISRFFFKGHNQSLMSDNVRLPAISGQSIGTGNYVVSIGLGTPKKDLTMILDTGSDLTWTQCLPCAVSCFYQEHLVFDPSRSTSYKNISYSSTDCSQMASGTSVDCGVGVPPGCYGSTCTYGIKYHDRSYSYGYFATERLTLSPTDTIDNFQFGCGQSNEGTFGKVDGLIGLGRKRISLVEQTATKYGRIFSYCLPKTLSSTGYLSLGKTGASSAVFTPMLTIPRTSFYGIEIKGIMVGGKQLSIPPTIFSRAGTFIDSGAVISRLPKTAYIALRDAFRLAMSNYPGAPPRSIFDTCYDLSKHPTATFPVISFTFGGGVKLDLTQHNIFAVYSSSQSCFAFAPNDDDTSMAIYGNLQQLSFEVIYDIPGRRIGFAPHGC